MMVHTAEPPQMWSAAAAARQDFRRTLALPPLIIKQDNPRLAELADVATTLGHLRLASRSTSPSSSSEYTLMELTPTTSESQPCRLPSFSETFSDLIAVDNSKPVSPRYYDHAPPPLFQQQQQQHHQRQQPPRRGSPGSEYSWQGGGGGGSAPGLSPLSTAHTSPAVSPTTPTYSIPNPGQLEIQVRLGLLGHTLDMVSNKRRLLLARSRRTSAAQQQHHHHHTQSRRSSGSSSSSSSSISSSGGCRAVSRRPSMTFHGNSNNNNSNNPHEAATGEEPERHFNQKYKTPDKLFIVYCKDDLRWGWPAIQARRLPLLSILLGNDYDRSVEERRRVSGLNGMYYRENDLNMPVLTPDGSGLEFVEREGRWWECTRSQKCRIGENGVGVGAGAGTSTSTSSRKGRGSVGCADPRPRGMVERYPEEVLLYWDKHVRHFVADDKKAEVYARAERYCRIRAEQRRQYGVPQWSPDNKDERVLDLNEPRQGTAADSSRGRRTLLRTRRS